MDEWETYENIRQWHQTVKQCSICRELTSTVQLLCESHIKEWNDADVAGIPVTDMPKRSAENFLAFVNKRIRYSKRSVCAVCEARYDQVDYLCGDCRGRDE